MFNAIKYLIILLASAWLGIQISHDPGYVLIQYRNIDIETSLWFALLSIIISVVVLLSIRSLIRMLVNGIGGISSIFTPNYKSRARKNKQLAIKAGLSEEWQVAAKHFLLANDSEKDILSLVSAIWSGGKKDINNLSSYLETAYSKAPENINLLNILHAKMLSNHQKYEEAIQKVLILPDKEQNNLSCLLILAKCYKNTANSEMLYKAITKLKKHKFENSNIIFDFEVSYYSTELNTKDKNRIEKYWKTIPKHVRKDMKLQEQYLKQLVHLSLNKQATSLIEQIMKNNFTDHLALIYASLDENKEAVFIKNITNWLKLYPNNQSLIHALARLYEKHGESLKAISCYEKLPLSNTKAQLDLINLYLELNIQDKAQRLLKNLNI